MRIFAIIALLLSLAGCSNDGEEILGAWKTERLLLGKPFTVILEKNRVIVDASSESPQYVKCEYEKHDGVITISTTNDNREIYTVKITDKDHITLRNIYLKDNYIRTTLDDIEAIKKAPATLTPVPKDPF